MEETRIVLVRHGQSLAQQHRVIGGHRGCKGLSDRGRAQVEAAIRADRRLARTVAAYRAQEGDLRAMAAAVLEEVFPAHPRHPGVLHYLIHSYDDPVHAPLGMRAARDAQAFQERKRTRNVDRKS